MNSREFFGGPYEIPTEVAQTDQGPAAVRAGDRVYVLFKWNEDTQVGMVARGPGTPWYAASTPPLHTDRSPAATPFLQSGPEDFIALVKAPDDTIKRAIFEGTSLTWGPVLAAQMGNRQFAAGARTKGWAYDAIETSDGPSAAEWGPAHSLFVVHRGRSSDRIYMQMRAVPIYSTAPVWAAQVRQPGLSNAGPLIVATEKLDGTPWALYLIHQGGSSNNIWWTSARGEN